MLDDVDDHEVVVELETEIVLDGADSVAVDDCVVLLVVAALRTPVGSAERLDVVVSKVVLADVVVSEDEVGIGDVREELASDSDRSKVVEVVASVVWGTLDVDSVVAARLGVLSISEATGMTAAGGTVTPGTGVARWGDRCSTVILTCTRTDAAGIRRVGDLAEPGASLP